MGFRNMQEKLENFNIRSDAHGQRHQSIDKPIVIWNVVIRESNFPSSIDYLHTNTDFEKHFRKRGGKTTLESQLDNFSLHNRSLGQSSTG